MSDGFGGDGFQAEVTATTIETPPDPTGLLVPQLSGADLFEDDGTTVVPQVASANTYAVTQDVLDYAASVGAGIEVGTPALSIEQAIVRARVRIDESEAKFFGQRSTAEQATALPRNGRYAGFARTNFIPPEVIRVQAAYALAELAAGHPGYVVGTGTTDAKVQRERKQVGDLEVEFTYFEPPTEVTGFSEGDRLLNALLSVSSPPSSRGAVRLKRA